MYFHLLNNKENEAFNMELEFSHECSSIQINFYTTFSIEHRE